MHGLEEGSGEPREESLREVIARLVDDGKDYAQAEFNRQKIRATELGVEFRKIAVLAGVAAVLVLCALIALVVGSLIALAPVIGAWGATALVVALSLLAAFALLIAARTRFRRLNQGERP